MQFDRSTTQWLKRARATDDPEGDLVADLRRSPDLRDFGSMQDLWGFLALRGACPEALDAVPGVWRRYLHWTGSGL
jgi:hypothetical protein